MSETAIRVGVTAPSTPITRDTADKVRALAAGFGGRIELVVHEQCFAAQGHFAGSDDVRLAAFVAAANDENLDAIWLARGGYGSCRMAEDALPLLGPAARAKIYLGYSDAGFLFGALYRNGFERVAHGPMLNDITRPGGEEAVKRALSFLLGEGGAGLESHVGPGQKAAAFNLTVLSHMVGTNVMPDLAGHVLLVEDVGEHLYRIDRSFFHVMSSAAVRAITGLRLGRVSEVIENDRPFGAEAEEIARFWCARSGVPFLGAADIGHDVQNKIVWFGARPG